MFKLLVFITFHWTTVTCQFAAEIRPSSNYGFLQSGWMNGYTELIDVGNNFNPQTGAFTLMTDAQQGFYFFQFQGYKIGGKRGQIQIVKNDRPVADITEGDDKNPSMITGLITLYLKKGDKVRLHNFEDDSIFVSRDYFTVDHPFTFTGYKM